MMWNGRVEAFNVTRRRSLGTRKSTSNGVGAMHPGPLGKFIVDCRAPLTDGMRLRAGFWWQQGAKLTDIDDSPRVPQAALEPGVAP